ncbi:DnaJ domain-containing protein [Nocardioides sp. LS1]|uniref:J domain-containing protein n=1 Tax=Nocardioides sp. LS1 TaxID=1027620 RepID=UPI000F61F094|nr:DnaJ domain-containing protein [Nocardioides sp. LS1]GCD89581.1 hypothetical protein NLS1_15870 [Nocardioides sp. LS1]
MSAPSWYDVLDVEPDASAEEIRAAWKARIADLEPTDRKFRVCNEAAEVLLDPTRRAAYDRERAGTPAPEAKGSLLPSAITDLRKPKKAKTPAVGEPTAAPATTSRRLVPGWALLVLAVLTVAVMGVAAWVAVTQPSDASVEDSTRAAQSAAERAVGPILSYNALHLDEDQQAAESYMTSKYREDYDKLFEVIKQNAPQTKTIVKAQVVASGIVRSGEDRVDVLLFVNRPTTNKDHSTPVVFKDQVTVTMQKVDGEWLVDDMATSPVSQ